MLRSIFIAASLLIATLTASAVEIAATLKISSGEYNDEIRPVLFRNNIEMASGTPVEVNLSAGVAEDVVIDSDFDATLRNGDYTLCFVGSDGQLIGKGVNVTVENDDSEMHYTAAIDEVAAGNATEIKAGAGMVEVSSDMEIASVNIYTISGSQVMAQHIAANDCSISTSSLASGMYVAQVTMADGSSITKKFIN